MNTSSRYRRCLTCIYHRNSYRFLLVFISLQHEKVSSNGQEVAASLLPKTDSKRKGNNKRDVQTRQMRFFCKPNRPSRCLKTITTGMDLGFVGLVVWGTVCVLSCWYNPVCLGSCTWGCFGGFFSRLKNEWWKQVKQEKPSFSEDNLWCS